MLSLSNAQITAWIGMFIWPLCRIAAMLMAAPVFSAQTVPIRIRIGLAVALTIVVMPQLPPLPVVEVFSFDSLWIIIQQLLLGLVLGVTLQWVLSAVVTGGQMVAMQMGLGFAAMVDPQNGTQTPIISQFYVIMVVLIYLSLNGHLVLFEVLFDSFRYMPIGKSGLQPENFMQLVQWAGLIFSGAVAIAIPAIASLLIVNFAFGIMTRAAPQLNIFAIGFPITMILGFAVMFATLPAILPRSTGMFNQAYQLLKSIIGIT